LHTFLLSFCYLSCSLSVSLERHSICSQESPFLLCCLCSRKEKENYFLTNFFHPAKKVSIKAIIIAVLLCKISTFPKNLSYSADLIFNWKIMGKKKGLQVAEKCEKTVESVTWHWVMHEKNISSYFVPLSNISLFHQTRQWTEQRNMKNQMEQVATTWLSSSYTMLNFYFLFLFFLNVHTGMKNPCSIQLKLE
jgi:hypothetical protein